jgi:hypothetical protein
MWITGQPPGQLAAVIRPADRIDYLIGRHVHIEQLERQNLGLPRRHWLDYDPVALAVLVIGIATIELLALMI